LGNKGYKVNRFHFSGVMLPQSGELSFYRQQRMWQMIMMNSLIVKSPGNRALFLSRKLRSLYSEPLYLKLKPLFFYFYITNRNIELKDNPEHLLKRKFC